MYRRLGLHMQIRLYYVLPYKVKISAQHRIGFILDRCIVYLGLTMSNLQKKHLLIFEIVNVKKCTLFFETEFINQRYYFANYSIKVIMKIELKSRNQTGKQLFRELDNFLLQASSSFLRMFSLLSGIYFPIYTYF